MSRKLVEPQRNKNSAILVRELRLYLGMTQAEFAVMVNAYCDLRVDASRVGKWERGLGVPNTRTLLWLNAQLP